MAGFTRQVLVVEDDADVRAVITEVLVEEGFQVVVAQDGREALDLLGAGVVRPAVVLLDLLMPYLDGADLLLAARALVPGFASVPVIVMSGVGKTSEWAPRLQGVHVWLDKPFELDDLVGALLSVTQSGADLARQILARRLLRHLGRHGELPDLRAALTSQDFATVAGIAARLRAAGQQFGEAALAAAAGTLAAAATRRDRDAVSTAIRDLADVVLGLQVGR